MTPPDIKVIAEIGINHFGSVELAKQLIDSAALSGASMVKFQYRNLQRVYSAKRQHLEIGDEIIRNELEKNYLAPAEICALADYAKTKGVEPGISFFNVSDIEDLEYEFDFYKVPSVELRNIGLIRKLLATCKPVFLSTGCANEKDIIDTVQEIRESPNWMLMHCISNYPVDPKNAQLGYINRLQKLTNRDVGYSSHDSNWEYCLLAATLGAKVIERHITLNKNDDGLDHSSSSTVQEFSQMTKILRTFPECIEGKDSARCPNQGERLNLQNLGRSLYAINDLNIGDWVTMHDFEERVPCAGIRAHEFKEYSGHSLTKSLLAGEALTESHLLSVNDSAQPLLDDSTQTVLNENRISLPVRLHDFFIIDQKFNLRNYEFHLSYEEILGQKLNTDVYPSHYQYSIHLPDYISSTHIIDPFAQDTNIANLSLEIIDRTLEFAHELSIKTGLQVPVIGSFSQRHTPREHFYSDCKKLISTYTNRSTVFLPQWLPPVAWYFGGSVNLSSFNSFEDIDYLEKYQIDICLDVCHFLMCLSARIVSSSDFNRLLLLSKHLHIADSSGTDGEGLQLFAGDPGNRTFLSRAIKSNNCAKVIEVWQGHLYDFKGFADALTLAASEFVK